MSTEVMKDVPCDKAAELARQFESVGCATEVKQQPDGLCTVIAKCPDE